MLLGVGNFYGGGDRYSDYIEQIGEVGDTNLFGYLLDPVTGKKVDNITIKQGDTLPVLRAVFETINGPVDLSGAVVRFHMGTPGGNVVVNALAEAEDAVGGKVLYRWASADTATSGKFLGEFQATFPNGTVLTAPNNSTFKVKIFPQVA